MMDQQQQQRMQMHPAMYGRMPHSGMMPSQQGHPGMPGMQGAGQSGGVSGSGPGGPAVPGGPQMGGMGPGSGGNYHMSQQQHPQHPSMMNNSQNNSYPGGVPPGPVPQGTRMPMPMAPHQQPYPHRTDQSTGWASPTAEAAGMHRILRRLPLGRVAPEARFDGA